MSFLKDVFSGRGLTAMGTMGLSELVGSDTMDKVPLLGTFYESDEEKALLAKQKQMAEEVKKRQGQMHTQSMNALGQQLAAFAPQNQMMAQMFGPGAAFTPEQMGAMAADPAGAPQADPSLVNYQGTDPGKQQEVEAYLAQLRQFQADEERRRTQAASAGAAGPGPAPLRPTQVAPARRY